MVGKTFNRINHQIRASKLRVIDQKGKQIGILPLPEALRKAQAANLDLVEIAPKAVPPVAKLIDFKKFRYLEEKRKKKEKKKKGGETKGIRLTPFIAEGDFNVRVKRAKEFLGQGNKIRVEIRFKGRQLARRNAGYELLGKFTKALADDAKIEQEPKWLGRSFVATLTPVKRATLKTKEKGKNEEKESKNENQKVSGPPVQSNQNR